MVDLVRFIVTGDIKEFTYCRENWLLRFSSSTYIVGGNICNWKIQRKFMTAITWQKWLPEQATRLRYTYVTNLVIFTNGSFVHTALYDTVANRTSKPTSAQTAQQADCLQQHGLPGLSCSLSYTPIRDPFSRSNPKKKKSLMTQAKSVLVQACKNGKNQTERLRYETNRTSL
jgi:hypothetical protein